MISDKISFVLKSSTTNPVSVQIRGKYLNSEKSWESDLSHTSVRQLSYGFVTVSFSF